MGDLSEHFSRFEFGCRCGCEFNSVDVELLRILEKDVRGYYNKVVAVTSGCRCFAWNDYVDGAEDSLHLVSKAADIIVEKTSVLAIYNHLNEVYPDKYGLGLYSNFIHIDVRPDRARWKG
jgi:uncharacterized protein YcbK (DUF882 family)